MIPTWIKIIYKYALVHNADLSETYFDEEGVLGTLRVLNFKYIKHDNNEFAKWKSTQEYVDGWQNRIKS